LRIIQVSTTNGQSPTDNLSQQRVNQSTVIDGNGNRVKMQVRQVNAYNERNRRFHHNNGNNENEDRNRRHNRNQRNRHNKWQ
jgi:predicted SAM-dependent methyltransferase